MSKLEDILEAFDTWCLCGEAECQQSRNFNQSKQQIQALIEEAVSEKREFRSGPRVIPTEELGQLANESDFTAGYNQAIEDFKANLIKAGLIERKLK